MDVGDLVFKHILGNFGTVKFDMPALFRAYMSTKRLEYLLPSPETEALEFQIFAVLHMARRCQWPLARALLSSIQTMNGLEWLSRGNRSANAAKSQRKDRSF